MNKIYKKIARAYLRKIEKDVREKTHRQASPEDAGRTFNTFPTPNTSGDF